MAKKRDNTENGEYIRISATQIGIYVALFVGGAGLATGLNWGSGELKVRAIQEKYDRLEKDYNNLKQESEKEEQQYWKEYVVHQGDVIIDQRVNCSITINNIFEVLGSVYIELYKFGEDGDSSVIGLEKAVPYNLTEEGDVFLVVKEIVDDTCTLIISEKGS